jgi:hypothetical protein
MLSPPIAHAKPFTMQCAIEKVAIKQWKSLACAMNVAAREYRASLGAVPDADASAQTSSTVPKPAFKLRDCYKNNVPTRGDRSLESWSRQNLTSRVLRNASFFKFVFLRDPLERFISAYLDKCINEYHRHVEKHCQPLEIFTENRTQAFFEANPKEAFARFVDTTPNAWDLHFVPQAHYCGGLSGTVHLYDFVGTMNASFTQQLEMLWEKLGIGANANITMADVFFSNDANARTQKTPPKAAPTTSTVRSRGHRRALAEKIADVKHNVDAEGERAIKYFSGESLARVIRYYALDYKAFGMELPKWLSKIPLPASLEHLQFQDENGRRIKCSLCYT